MLRHAVQIAQRSILGVLLIDIDRFKIVNDCFGHLEGDACLIAVTRACASCLRSQDTFARYGGEEFAAIIHRAQTSDLEPVAARMCAAVTALQIANGSGGILTVSIGGAALRLLSSADAKTLIRAADRNLYNAKQAGRNCAVLG